jgi:hypothetical protein
MGCRAPTIEEHQLDYDWRFAEASGNELSEYAGSADNVLLVGCPSLAPRLVRRARKVLLVERNPNYACDDESIRVVYADLRFDSPALAGHFTQAFVDPPWYPQELLHWINFGLSQIEIGSFVFFSLWPESVRPSAREEHRKILSAMSKVGRLVQLGDITYELPLFERKALQAAGQAASKREGLLFRLTKQSHHLLEVPRFQKTRSEWWRFSLSEEQLAILVSPVVEQKSDELFEIAPFTLADTSRRNSNLPNINIWTSKNCVARLTNPSKFAERVAARDRASLLLLAEAMKMSFDPLNINWGRSWRHPA